VLNNHDLPPAGSEENASLADLAKLASKAWRGGGEIPFLSKFF